MVSERAGDAAAREPIPELPRPTDMRTVIISIMILTAAVTGCGHVSSVKSGPSSGIAGTIRVDVGCPQVTSTPCPTVPLHARLLIHPIGSAGSTVRVESGSNGHFRVALAPGRYRIQPQNVGGTPVPTAGPISVTVRSRTWTTVHIQFDSGVR